MHPVSGDDKRDVTDGGAQRVRLRGPPRAEGVLVQGHVPPGDRGVHRVDDGPRRLELVAADEVRLMAVHGVQQEPLVRASGSLAGGFLAELLRAPPAAEFHLARNGLDPKPGLLDRELHVHLLVGLEPKDELVRTGVRILLCWVVFVPRGVRP